MNRMKLAVTVYLAIFGVLTVSAADAASLNPELAPQVKIEECVAELEANTDYTGASKIKHVIESKLSRHGTHKQSIATQVLDMSDDTVIREYASVCFVRKGDRPVLIRISERS